MSFSSKITFCKLLAFLYSFTLKEIISQVSDNSNEGPSYPESSIQ